MKGTVEAEKPAEGENGTFGSLYSHPVPSKRTGAIYNVFSYPTKIDAQAVPLFIAGHTNLRGLDMVA